MSVGLYMDVHVPGPVTRGLRLRGVDVVTAQEVGADEWPDDDLVDHAMRLGRFMVTQDEDFLAIVDRRRRAGRAFGGVVFFRQGAMSVARAIDELRYLSLAAEPSDLLDQFYYLPM